MTTAAAPRTSLGEQFRAAATMLAGDHAGQTPDPRVLNFLQSLGFWPKPADAAHRDHLARMLRLAAGLERFFRLDSPFAPGARFCGGADSGTEDRPGGNYAGRGLGLGSAFLTCIGEAAEYSAMYRRANDRRVSADTIPGQSLVSGAEISLDAAEVLRTSNADTPQPSSTGYAAGPSFAAATEGAFLECVERDAIARWSLGETRAVRISPDDSLQMMASTIGRTTVRPILFGDISPANALARSAVAISADNVIGTAFGFGSAFSTHDACRKALLELCQGEIGLLMIDRKVRDGGETGLSPKEAAALERARAFQPGRGMLDFAEKSDASATSPEDFTTATIFAGAKGVDILTCDITVAGEDIPVARVCVTGLFDAATMPEQTGLPPLL
jgi:ribosomal protein S12 methylthiotransferase accessory factor YcaO